MADRVVVIDTMADTDPCAFDAESLDELLDRTVEVPAALLMAAACRGRSSCCCC